MIETSPISSFIISITAFIVALTVHEFSHAATAYLLGDPTAQQKGRLTLNPFAHIDPLGLILLILVQFGWARPVPFNPYNFSYPRLYSVVVGLAGPASNFLLAILCTFSLHHATFLENITYAQTILIFLKTSIWINVMLGVFNMLPIPPLDGSHLLRSIIPRTMLSYYAYFEQISFILLIILIMLTPLPDILTQWIKAVIFWLDYRIP